jgi:hypothetical protein
VVRIGQLVARIAITLALVCAGVIVSARNQPPTGYLRDLGFGRCAGRPCFQGIVPGDTTWQEAVQRMSRLLDVTDPLALRYATLDRHGIAVSFGGAHPVSPEYVLILFFYDNRRALFGDLVALYGAPCVLALPRYMGGKINVNAFAAQYDTLIAAADSATGRVSAFSRLASVRLSATGADQQCVVDVAPSVDVYKGRWAGFLRTTQYAARQP